MGAHLFSPTALLARVMVGVVVRELRHDGLPRGRLLPKHPPDRPSQGGRHGPRAGRLVAAAVTHEGGERCDGQRLVRQEAALEQAHPMLRRLHQHNVDELRSQSPVQRGVVVCS